MKAAGDASAGPTRNSLLQTMLDHADPSQVAGLSRFFKTGPGQYGEGDKFLGIKVPVTREVVRGCWKEMLPADWQERASRSETPFPELEECIRSEYHEVRLAALLTLVEIFKHAKRSFVASAPQDDRTCHSERLSCHSERSEESIQHKCVDFYLAHTAFINNWDLVDLSCYPLLGEWLLDKDRSLLYDLARNGRTLWEQRIGIVSTMTFIRHGQLDDTFAIADILLHHPHDLIHKAVGWLLREAGKKDKAALEAYLNGRRSFVANAPQDDNCHSEQPSCHSERTSCHSEQPSCHSERSEESHRYLQMPRTMLRYAIEKFPEADRQLYLTGHAH